jgi:hypothetical protein
MEVLFHFVFELFKIALLASAYAIIIVFAVSRIARHRPGGLWCKISAKKTLLWFISGFIISVILFVYMFSYWGNHGLGDFARIPVGHGKSVDQIDAHMTFITAQGFEYEVLCIDKYALTRDFLFVETDRDTNKNDPETAAWNLKTNKVMFFRSSGDMDTFKIRHHIDAELKFQDFRTHYTEYWNGWRFWLLP